MTDQWGIWIENLEHGKWMVDGYLELSDGQWEEIPAVYGSKRRAQTDAKVFNKDSRYKYVAKPFKDNH